MTPTAHRSGARRALGPALLLAVPLATLVFFVLVPLVGMLGRGLGGADGLDLGGVLEVLGRGRVHRVLWFTLWSSALATVLALVVGLPAAFVLYRLDFPGRSVLRLVVTAPFVLPTVVVGVAFRTLLGRSGLLGGLSLDGTATAVIAGLVFFNVSVVVRVVGSAWAGVDPRPAMAASALGATPAQVLRTVTLPMLRPALTAAGTLVFLFCATAFGVVLTLGGLHYATVETEIYLLTTQFLDLRAAAVLSLLQLAVTGVLLLASLRGNALPRTTADQPPRRPKVADLPWLGATVGLGLLLLAPMASLVLRSLRREGHWSTDSYQALMSSTADGEAPLAALGLSLRIAVDATAVAVVLALAVAVAVSRASHARSAVRRAVGLVEGLFAIPLGVSAVTIGFGLLITLDRPPFHLGRSVLLVPIAQGLVALPFVVRVVVPAFGSVDDRLREAAASLGASPLRVFLSVDLPLVRRSLLAATGFAFAVCIGEFGATSFLARPGAPTLPVLVYQLIGRPSTSAFDLALAAAVLLAAVTVGAMAAVDRVLPEWGGARGVGR